MTPIPRIIAYKSAFGRFYRSNYFYVFTATLAGNGIALIDKVVNWKKQAALDAAVNVDPSLQYYMAGGITLVIISGFLSLVRILKEFAVNQVDGPDYGFDAVLTTALVGLQSDAKSGNAKLRICVHVADEKRLHWIQRTNYHGHGGGSGKGQKQQFAKGIVGAALRTAKISISRVTKTRNRVETLMSHGYSKAEAEGMRGDARSWAAFPICYPKLENSAFAVIFLDSSDPDFFSGNNKFRRRLLETCVLAIADLSETKR